MFVYTVIALPGRLPGARSSRHPVLFTTRPVNCRRRTETAGALRGPGYRPSARGPAVDFRWLDGRPAASRNFRFFRLLRRRRLFSFPDDHNERDGGRR